MDAGENRSADHRKKCHRFRRTVDGGTPLLPEQKQDCGDECAGMSDTDPKNEIGNVPSPADRDLISPCADPGGNLVSDAKKSKRRGACSNGERHPPPARRGLFHHAGNAFRQPTEITPVQYQRNTRNSPLGLFNRSCCCWRRVHNYIASSTAPVATALGTVGTGLVTGTRIQSKVFRFILVPSPPSLRLRCFRHQAFSDSDCESARDNWFAP